MTTTLEASREGEPTAYPPVETQPETQPGPRRSRAARCPSAGRGPSRCSACSSRPRWSCSTRPSSTSRSRPSSPGWARLPRSCSGWWRPTRWPSRSRLITGSRLGDLWGRKRVFLGGLVGFTLMSAACGFAPNAEALVGFRALQGIAAAAMIPQVLSSLQVMYAPHERAKAMGLFTGLAGLSAVLGPVIGAVLTEADLGGLGLALDLPRQRPVRRAGDRGRAALGAGIRCHPTPPHRPAWCHGARRRSARRALPAHHGARAGLARLGVCRDGRRCGRPRASSPGRRSVPSGPVVSRWWRSASTGVVASPPVRR